MHRGRSYAYEGVDNLARRLLIAEARSFPPKIALRRLAIIVAIQDATDLPARTLRTGWVFQHRHEARTRRFYRKRRQRLQHCVAITPRRVGAFHGAQLAEQQARATLDIEAVERLYDRSAPFPVIRGARQQSRSRQPTVCCFAVASRNRRPRHQRVNRHSHNRQTTCWRIGPGLRRRWFRRRTGRFFQTAIPA